MAAKAQKITVKISDRHITIRYDGHAHLRLLRKRLLGFQSWKEGRFYCIEYYLVGRANAVLTEYTRRNDWEFILGKLVNALPNI